MTTLQPPGRCIPLVQAIEGNAGHLYDVIGICVDHLPPVKSRGTDEVVTFTLSDPSWFMGLGMKFRYFAKTKSRLPAIQNTGDVVILRNAKNLVFGGSTFGVSTFNTTWFVLVGSSIQDSKCPNGSDIQVIKPPPTGPFVLNPTVEELQYAKEIAAQADPSSFQAPAKATNLQIESIMRESGGTPPPRRDKWRLLQDLQLDRHSSHKFSDGRPAFADLFGEVRKIYKGDFSRVDLCLTDYTSNSKLYSYDPAPTARDGDEFGYIGNNNSWPGPWGKMTINVSLWDAHAGYARAELKERMFVLIKNCQVKFDLNGAILEAACRGDRADASKVNVSIHHPHEANRDERLKGLIRRRRDYEKEALKKGWLNPQPGDDQSLKRWREEPESNRTTSVQDDAKKSRFRARKLNRKAKQQAVVATAAGIKDNIPSLPALKAVGINEHIRCNGIDIPVTPIHTILGTDLLARLSPKQNGFHIPFQNVAYKCKVRVVDFYPDDIANFAVPCEDYPEMDSSKDDKQAKNDSNDIQEEEDLDVSFNEARARAESVRWEWRFMLIVVDATPSNGSSPKARLPVLVVGQNGDCLILEDACDLQQNQDVLARTREKLWHVWGDLEEQKEEVRNGARTEANMMPSSLPFECLIEEYGIANAKGDYKRLFQLFGTTTVG